MLVSENHRLGAFGYMAHPELTAASTYGGSGNYGQMDLIGFDDWNVIMCAMDERTRETCGLPGFPGGGDARERRSRATSRRRRRVGQDC